MTVKVIKHVASSLLYIMSLFFLARAASLLQSLVAAKDAGEERAVCISMIVWCAFALGTMIERSILKNAIDKLIYEQE